MEFDYWYILLTMGIAILTMPLMVLIGTLGICYMGYISQNKHNSSFISKAIALYLLIFAYPVLKFMIKHKFTIPLNTKINIA